MSKYTKFEVEGPIKGIREYEDGSFDIDIDEDEIQALNEQHIAEHEEFKRMTKGIENDPDALVNALFDQMFGKKQ